MKKRFAKSVTDVRAKLGESFVLALPVLATAGYAWRVGAEPEVAVLRAQRILPAGPALGAPSTQEFEFAGVRPGKGTLVLEYKRPWEAAAAERLTVEIVVDHGD